MKISKRMSLMMLFLGLFALLVIVFPTFILDNFVTPIALVLWLFWRILLSADQNIYWGLLILWAGIYAFARLSRLAQESIAGEQTSPPDTNAALEHVNYWRMSIHLTRDEIEKFNSLKRNLNKILITLYASRQPDIAPFEIHAALKQRRIPLPEPVYAFLFPAEPSGARRSFRQILHTLKQIPGRRVRRWTGQDVAEYYQSIEDVIRFMESALETQHGDEHFDTEHH